MSDIALRYREGAVDKSLIFARSGDEIHMELSGGCLVLTDVTNAPAKAADGKGTGILLAPLDGAVTEISVAPGETVEKGQVVLVIEAMKMQHQIKSDVNGVVASIHVTPSAQVKTRQQLVEVTPA